MHLDRNAPARHDARAKLQKVGQMTLEQISEALTDRRLSVVARATGLTRETIRRFRDGKAQKPEHETVRRLVAYFEGRA